MVWKVLGWGALAAGPTPQTTTTPPPQTGYCEGWFVGSGWVNDSADNLWTLGWMGCDDVVQTPIIFVATEQGRAHPVYIRNVMVRPDHFKNQEVDASFVFEPIAESIVQLNFNDFVVPATSAAFDVTADAVAHVGKILQPRLLANKLTPRADAVGQLEGYAAGTEYSRLTPEADAKVGLTMTLPMVPDSDVYIEPRTIKNPTEEELVAIIMSRRKRLHVNNLTTSNSPIIYNQNKRKH